MDVFREKRRTGKTVVLVTHDMTAVQSFCDRAMLIHDGELRYIGDPEETALRYYRQNFAGDSANGSGRDVLDVNVRIVEASLRNSAGDAVENIEQGEPIGIDVVFEARHDLEDPVFGFHFLNADGETVFGFNENLKLRPGEPNRLAAGQRAHISGTVENRLLPGRYLVNSWISRNRAQGDLALHVVRLLEFVVYGTRPGPGSVAMNADVAAEIQSRVPLP
jgi:ABC-type sugar transport system ATPase subunit